MTTFVRLIYRKVRSPWYDSTRLEREDETGVSREAFQEELLEQFDRLMADNAIGGKIVITIKYEE